MDIQTIDHVEFYVEDAARFASFLCTAFGFQECGRGGASIVLGQGDIRLLVTAGRTPDDPASRHVRRHGDGVGCIGLRTGGAARAFAAAVSAGADPVAAPVTSRGAVVGTVAGPGGLSYRLVERRSAGEEFLPGIAMTTPPAGGGGLEAVDHLALCVPAGQLDSTVERYRTVFGFGPIFSERVEVGDQAMDSTVVQSRSGKVTITLVTPDPAGRPGQLDDFLAAYGGPGVQHLAYRTHDIATAVSTFSARGVRFLHTPSSYYDAIAGRLGPVDLPVERLRAGNILVDRDHSGELFQIFTESIVDRRTLFFELIERHGAVTFGSNNIRALYEAKERERAGTPTG
jgi:4-hydroxymandelate synthase